MADEQEGEGKPFVIVSANFGGGAREVKSSDKGTISRPDALGGFIKDPSGKGCLEKFPVVAGIQEVTRIDPVCSDRDVIKKEVIGAQSPGTQFFYVPRVTTEWHPLSAKWQRRWDDGIVQMEQGMATCSLRGANLIDPEKNKPRACKDELPFKGMVLDLPVVEFRKSVEAEDKDKETNRAAQGEWFSHVVILKGAKTSQVQFRHSRYRGNRDTEPRVATAHRVQLDGDVSGDLKQEFVFINLHLTTLFDEDKRGGPAIGGCVSRKIRKPTDEAKFLRHLQLSEICDFIWYVYTDERLRLPVVVAGDFNSTPSMPDLEKFMKDACLEAVFRSDQCWKCGGKPSSKAMRLYTDKKSKAVLTKTPEEFKNETGKTAKFISTKEYCSDCNELLFTHKRNFGLIDNILYTSGQPTDPPLRTTIEPQGCAGIRIDTYFSDHLPIWCLFRLKLAAYSR